MRISCLFVVALLVALASAYCGHDQVMEKYLRQGNNSAIHQAIRRSVHEEIRARSQDLDKRATELRIPIVWHVLYDPAIPETRLSRATIEREMTYLNDWFHGRNTYYTTSDIWGNVVATGNELNIRFELAVERPDRSAFDGIEYIQSSLAGSGCDFGSTDMFFTSRGGVDNWDPNSYYNVYTCGIPGGTTGFAYSPDGTAAYDNCVLDYPRVGSSSDLGSTLAHETGHWLGLPHTFAGDQCNSANPNADDNLVNNDTPDTDVNGLNYIQSFGGASCQAGFDMTSVQRCGHPVMYTNVMDYGYDTCQRYFTKGQAQEMRGYLTSSTSRRRFLGNSHALSPQCPTFDCYNKQCGSNGCGGTCGSCGAYSTCNADQQCVSTLPTNLGCTTAMEIPQSTNGFTYDQNTVGTSGGWTMGNCYGDRQGPNALWYRFTAESSGTVTLTSTASALPSMMSVFRATSECSGSFYCAGGGAGENLSFSVQQGQLFFIVLSSTNGQLGDLSITMTVQGSGFGCEPNCAAVEPTPSSSRTPAPSPSRTSQPSDSPTRTRTRTPSRTPPPSNSPSRASSPSPSPSRPPSTTRTAAASNSPTRTRSRTPSRAPSSTPASSSTNTGTRTATPSPAAEPPCVPRDSCAALGYECGIATTACGPNTNCGSCSSGQTCSSNHVCTCPVGTSPNNAGQCVSDYSQTFEQISPDSSSNNYVIENGVIRTTTSQLVLLSWPDSNAIMDDYSSVESFFLQGSSGTFYVAYRQDQGNGRSLDRLGWELQLNGATANMRMCMWYYGNPYCTSYATQDFPTANGMEMQHVMSLDDETSQLYSYIFWKVGTTTYWRYGYVSSSYYPNRGELSFGLQGTGIRLSDIKLVTRSAIEVALTDCVSEEEFERMFYTLSLADPSTTSWTVDVSTEDANCKALGHGKALLSSFVVSVSSVGAPASAIAQTFVSNAATSGAVISTAAVIPGTAGAAAAGIPALPAAGASGFAGVIPGTAAAGAGAGGGAAGGLSGGAIAGIVIGSVAGGVLLLGLTAVVIGAVVVGAVALSKRDSDSAPSRSEGSQRRSVRQTIVGLFGGVDVMNDPGKGHQSISGRSPAMA